MIRFVDIRNQDTGYRFAFWNTIYDKFCEFSGEQAWDTKAEFLEAFDEDNIERFTRLMPLWTETKEPNTEY